MIMAPNDSREIQLEIEKLADIMSSREKYHRE